MTQEKVKAGPLLPQAAQENEYPTSRGQLKIFFGYAAGVGKTYAMLQAAHETANSGVDVVVGYVEPHARPETEALLQGLEVLPTLAVPYRGAVLQELDLDGVMRRKPQLVLIDEMAHTNARGLRHVKRYQDIQELLHHGIDVYTTVNVQHVESLNDVVQSITGVVVRERVPDHVFDGADMELVDIAPEDLLERLEQGKVYKEQQARQALEHFFSIENLTALREISLRRVADIVNKAVEKNRTLQRRSDYFTQEHLLVCLSSSPSNARVIRTAARMAEAFYGKLTALFVETSATLNMSRENRARLESNIRLAEELGAHLATVQGDDVPWHVAEFAKASGISKIVIGSPGGARLWLLRKPNFIDQLNSLAPNLDIYVIPNLLRPKGTSVQARPSFFRFSWQESLICLCVLAASTAVGFLLHALKIGESSIVIVYMLGVLLASINISGVLYITLYSFASVLLFNFCFTEPRLSFHVYNSSYLLTFGVMFLVSIVISTLTSRLHRQKLLASQKAYRTSFLLETSQKLQGLRGSEAIIRETASQLMQLLGRTVLIYPVLDNKLGTPVVEEHSSQGNEALGAYQSNEEMAVAQWCVQNNKQAGAGTNTLPGARCLYVCVQGQEEVLGVAGVVVDNAPLDAFEKGLLEAVLGECALALEKERIRESKDRIFLQAKQESLRANLLRAISHDLRTPLTSISGNAYLLLSRAGELTEETKQRLYGDMYDDTVWLVNLVENILALTRLESGELALRTEPELLADCISEAIRHVTRRSTGHNLTLELDDDLLMAHMDARLITQVLVNLLDNAIKYTPSGSNISIAAKRNKDKVEVTVADNGKGISSEAKSHLFEMFYTAGQNLADSRRGLGLGLFLCKSIINAHGGSIDVTDNVPQGAVFSFSLRAAEVTYA